MNQRKGIQLGPGNQEKKYAGRPRNNNRASRMRPRKKIHKRANGKIQEKTQSLTLCCIEMLILSQQSHRIL